MKICTLILTYDAPLYNYFDNIKRAYLEQENANYLFVYNGTDTTKHSLAKHSYNYTSDIIHPSGIPVMFNKFIDVIRSGVIDKYDFIVRVNSSTFIDINRVRKELETRSSNIYMGFFRPDWNFVSGACSIFSRDVLKKISDNAHLTNIHQEDDVAIGQLLYRLGVPKTFLDRYCFESHIQDTHITIPAEETIREALTYPQIRVRNNSNRELIDKGIWNMIAQNVIKQPQLPLLTQVL